MRYSRYILFLIALSLSPLSYGLPLVTAANLSANAEHRSLQIEFTSKVKYNVFSLTDPNRLVIDLEHTDRRSLTKVMLSKNFVSGVTGFRIGVPTSGITRLVIDLNKGFSNFKASALSTTKGKERILIEWDMTVSPHPTITTMPATPTEDRSLDLPAANHSQPDSQDDQVGDPYRDQPDSNTGTLNNQGEYLPQAGDKN